MKVIFKKALLSLVMVSIVPTIHAEQPPFPLIKVAFLSAVSSVCAVALLQKVAPIIKKYRLEWECQKSMEESNEKAVDFFEKFVCAEAEKMGLDPMDLDLEFGDEWACRRGKWLDLTLIVPPGSEKIFYNGKSDKRYHLCRGSLAHELGHVLYFQKFLDKADIKVYGREMEEFADSCVPDNEQVLIAERDNYVNRFLNESLFNFCFVRDCLKKLDEEIFVENADKWYREHYPKDVHPSNISRAKYFNDRLKALKEKQKKEQFVRSIQLA